MYKYIESVHGYNFSTSEFKRFGKTEWRIYYTAKAIIVNGRYASVYHDMDWAYKIRKDGLYTTYDNAKDFVEHFFHDKLSVEAWQEDICHQVFKLGKQVKGMDKENLYFITNDTPFDCGRPYEEVCQDYSTAKLLAAFWHEDYIAHGYSMDCELAADGEKIFAYTKGEEKHKIKIIRR